MAALEELVAGAVVEGLSPAGPVTVVSMRMNGSSAATVVFRDEATGAVDQKLLVRSDEHKLRIVERGRHWAFDGDGGFAVAAAGLACVMLAFLVYRPHLTDFFALDDFIWLNAAQSPNALRFFKGAFSFPTGSQFDPATPFWRPLVDSYFYAAWRMFGTDPLPYHVLNLLIHSANAVLVGIVVRSIARSAPAALCAAVLFVVLPTYDYAVTWISSVTELLGTFFFLLTLVLYAHHLQQGGSKRLSYFGAIASLLLALLSKESSVTIPIVLAALALSAKRPKTRAELTELARDVAPFAALTLVYFVYIYVEEYRSGEDTLYGFGWHARGNLWDYLKWMTLPVADDWAPWVGPARPYAASAFLILGSLSVALRAPVLGFCFLWTLAALLPYSFFPAGIEYRYTYLASIPLTVFVVHLVADATRRFRARLAPVAALAFFLPLIVLFLSAQARERQARIGDQAQAFDQMVHAVPQLCGQLAAESHVFLLNSPIADYYGVSTRAALNLYHDRIYTWRAVVPDLAAAIKNKCVLQYDPVARRYVRLE